MSVMDAFEGARQQDSTDVSTPRVLVLGRSPEIMETVLGELRDAGVAAQGSIDPEHAAAECPAEAFDLVALGGGLKGPVGAHLKRRLRERNPRLRFLDTSAPVAAHEIVAALAGPDPAAQVALDAYFTRIGYSGPRVPTLETLRVLQRLHIAAVPFEAIDVLMDRGVDLSPAAVDAKLILRRRGGYCFEQNGLFMRVLRAVGFEVEGLLARVRWMAPAGAAPPAATHMTLRVTVDGQPWLVDVGFGSSGPPAPLDLNTVIPQQTVHETYRILPFARSMLLQARLDERWASLYEILPEPAAAADYETGNWFTSTHPSSHFRHMLTVARTTSEARYALRDHRLTIRTTSGEVGRFFLDADGIEEALGTTFRLPVADDWRPVIERIAAQGAAAEDAEA